MFSTSTLVLFFRLGLSIMSNAIDATLIQETVQGSTVQNYIEYATLSVLIYDIRNAPLLLFAAYL